MHSALYTGRLSHHRRRPVSHAFDYPLCYAWLDLAELDEVFRGRWLWSTRRPALAWLRRADYLGDAAVPLDTALRDRVEVETGRRPAGPVRLLTQLRTWGHCFNPVSFYYCYRRDGETLDCILAEITNTPWKERHSYVLPTDDATRHGRALHFRFDKRFHVSPFLPMQRRYDWRFQTPDDHLRVHMDVNHDGGRDFDATLMLAREPISRSALHRALWRYPLMTLQVVAAIHWHAFIIWCKQNPVYDHPGKSKAAP